MSTKSTKKDTYAYGGVPFSAHLQCLGFTGAARLSMAERGTATRLSKVDASHLGLSPKQGVPCLDGLLCGNQLGCSTHLRLVGNTHGYRW